MRPSTQQAFTTPPPAQIPCYSTQIARIEGYAAIFNFPDQSGDTLSANVFDDFFSGIVIPARSDRVSMLYQHKVDCPIGCWKSFKADKKGLFVSGYLLLDVPKAREVHVLARSGALNGLSIGFRAQTATKRLDGGRHVTQAQLWEVSVVTFPMANDARISHVGEPEPALSMTSLSNPERAGLRT